MHESSPFPLLSVYLSHTRLLAKHDLDALSEG